MYTHSCMYCCMYVAMYVYICMYTCTYVYRMVVNFCSVQIIMDFIGYLVNKNHLVLYAYCLSNKTIYYKDINPQNFLSSKI